MAKKEEQQELLNQFKLYFKTSMQAENYKAMLKQFNLKTIDQFKEFVDECFKLAIENEDVSKEFSTALENLLSKVIVPCLKEQDAQVAAELQKILDLDRNNQAAFIVKLQKFLKDLLTNQNNKKIIMDNLWEAYFAYQQENSMQNTGAAFSQRAEGAFEMHIGQAQADPLKRAGMLIFEALFSFLDVAMYVSSGGSNKLSNGNDTKGVSLAEMSRRKHGGPKGSNLVMPNG